MKNSSIRLRPALRVSAFCLLLVSIGIFSVPSMGQEAKGKPALMLAKVYHPGVVLKDYWVSEKYDGVRGFWDGEKLLTRGGELVTAPAWFTAGWPKTPMDGELWVGRGQFSKAVSTVRQHTPGPTTDADWRGICFMVFDLPAQPGPFTDRILPLNTLVAQINQPWVRAVTQYKLADRAALQIQLKKTIKLGGEGLMLHRGDSLYKGLRNDDLLKFKAHEDAEARVVGHIPGKGKYADQVGALLVEMPATDDKPGRRFKLGTGLTDAQRKKPPPVGSNVTYRFRGLNDSGIPHFASFMRIRED